MDLDVDAKTTGIAAVIAAVLGGLAKLWNDSRKSASEPEAVGIDKRPLVILENGALITMERAVALLKKEAGVDRADWIDQMGRLETAINEMRSALTSSQSEGRREHLRLDSRITDLELSLDERISGLSMAFRDFKRRYEQGKFPPKDDTN